MTERTSIFRISLLLWLVLTVLVASLSATPIFVTSVAALNPNDTYNWSSHGVGAVPDGTNLATIGGLGFSIANNANDLDVSKTAGFFSSNGGTDEFLESRMHDPQVITFNFSSPVYGFGAAPEWGGYEVASYMLTIFGSGGPLASFSINSPGKQGEPQFIGVFDNTPAIVSAQFSYDGPTAPHSAGLGDLYFITPSPDVPQPPAVPEPASLALLGTGIAALAGSIRRKLNP